MIRDSYSSQAREKVVAFLQAQSQAASLADVAAGTGYARTTVSRVMSDLRNEGKVNRARQGNQVSFTFTHQAGQSE